MTSISQFSGHGSILHCQILQFVISKWWQYIFRNMFRSIFLFLKMFFKFSVRKKNSHFHHAMYALRYSGQSSFVSQVCGRFISTV